MFCLCVLGVDHSRPIVYEHCKKLLQNLLLLASSQDNNEIARLLLDYRSSLASSVKILSEDRETSLTEGRCLNTKQIQMMVFVKYHYYSESLYNKGQISDILLSIIY